MPTPGCELFRLNTVILSLIAGTGRIQAAGEPRHHPQRGDIRVRRLLPRYRNTLIFQ